MKTKWLHVSLGLMMACAGFCDGTERPLRKVSPSAEVSTDRPSILALLADDLNWSLLGLNGGITVPSPNLDRLAKEGVLLTQFYVQSVCSATGACLMTGRSPACDWPFEEEKEEVGRRCLGSVRKPYFDASLR